MEEVTDGIYQLPVPLPNSPLGHINAYLIQADNGYLLVDTGWDTDEAFGSLKRQLAEIGARPEEITQIVITHIHPDHYGLAGRLKQLSQATIALHRREKANIRSRYVNMDRLLQRLARWLAINGVPADELPSLQIASTPVARFVVPTLPDITLHGGETITAGSFNFTTLWTPGHSPGHISLYEPTRKILISGDHILPNITPNIALHPQSGPNPLDDYLNALNTVKQLEVELVLPGHEHPFNNLPARIDDIIRHHQQRNLEILETMKGGTKTAYHIATEVTWMPDTRASGWQGLRPLDRRLAILETISHLEFMRFEGRVAKFSRDSLIYYQLPDATEKN
jgi:glyoxylase-like metal-dependent hydrolase (beta-lactamase superfamily II)